MKIESADIDANTHHILDVLNCQGAELFDNYKPGTKTIFSINATEDKNWLGGAIANLFGNTMHLSILGVDANFRRRRIGTHLLSEIEKLALDNHCLYLTVNTQDYQARNFYEKFGFEVFGYIEDTPFIGTVKFYMRKKLTK